MIKIGSIEADPSYLMESKQILNNFPYVFWFGFIYSSNLANLIISSPVS